MGEKTDKCKRLKVLLKILNKKSLTLHVQRRRNSKHTIKKCPFQEGKKTENKEGWNKVLNAIM